MLEKKIQTTAAILVSLISITIILQYTKQIMLPLMLAGFVVFIIQPFINFLVEKAKFPEWLSIIAVLLSVILVSGFIALLVTSSVSSALGNIEEYKARIVQVTNHSITWLGHFGIEFNIPEKERLAQSLQNLPIFQYLSKTVGKMVSVVGDVVLVLLFVMFLLTGKKMGLGKIPLVREVDAKIKIYLFTKVSTSLVTGILTTLILLLVDLDMAIMFGVLAYLLNFIPTVGSLVAALLPIPIALIQFDENWKIIYVITVPGAIQFIVGNIVEPKFMGDSLDLHPITIMLALMFWGLIWGVIGMIVAAPITVMIKIVLDKMPQTKPFSELMAGRLSIAQ